MASEYGWALKQILEETCVDDFLELTDVIKKRKIVELKTQLAIVQNPYSEDPKRLWDILDSEIGYIEQESLDKLGLERLKQTLGKGSSIVVK